MCGSKIGRIILRSYSSALIERYTKMIYSLLKHQLVAPSGPVPLPNKVIRRSFPSSPFGHKTAVDQYEMTFHTRVLWFFQMTQEGFQAFCSINIEPGVEIELKQK